MNKMFLALFSAVVMSVAAVSEGSAGSITVSDITGAWADKAIGGRTVKINPGAETGSLAWGATNFYNRDQSAFEFQSAGSVSSDQANGAIISLGGFSHFNNPILGASLTSAALAVSTNLAIDGVNLGAHQFEFNLDHLETVNFARRCENGGRFGVGVNAFGCADMVTLTNVGDSRTLLVDGVLYTLAIAGFIVDGELASFLETMERGASRAQLALSVSVAEALETPIPAAAALFIAGVAGLGFATGSRHRKARAL